MRWHRIYAIILRYMYLFRHSYDRMSDVFYWPTIDLLLWGLTSKFLRDNVTNIPNIILIILSGLLLWIILWRSQYEITVGLLEDLWNKNLVNIFVAPLKFSEWIVSLILLGLIKAFVSFSFAVSLAYFLYATNIFTLGFSLIPFIFLLVLTGWWLGFFVAGIIMRVGTKVQTFAWTMAYILSPFSAIYYPVSTLPEWAQHVARFVPTSYVFEGARHVIATGKLDWNSVAISFLLNLFYLAISLIFLHRSFKKILGKGLVNLY